MGDEYYKNKIAYALSKIDYAQSRINKEKDRKPLSKIYNAFLLYGSKIKLQQLIKVTNLSRDEIVPHLKTLKELGLVSWDGSYLNANKVVQEQQRATKPTFAEWYKKFKEDYDKKYGEHAQLDDETVEEETEFVEIPLKNGAILKVPTKKIVEVFT